MADKVQGLPALRFRDRELEGSTYWQRIGRMITYLFSFAWESYSSPLLS